MTWEVRANLGVHGHGWLWEITRDDEVAHVAVEISEGARASDPLRLPDDTRQALETDGRSELLKVLDQDEPPGVIRCDSKGCASLYPNVKQ